MPGGGLVVVLQGDLLEPLRTRVVAPLLPASMVGRPMRALNPVVRLGDADHVLAPQLTATLDISEPGERVGSLSALRDEIVRAMDAAFSGV